MAASILSQDIMSICLVLADGNIELSIEEVIQRIETYQVKEDRHFGISITDFRGLFYNLIYQELQLKNIGDAIGDIKLEDLTTNIVKFYDAFFNDEGEYWDLENINIHFDFLYINYWYGYTEQEYKDKLNLKIKMIDFFCKNDEIPLSPEKIKSFMKKHDISNNILLTNSRPGKSS